MKKRVVDIAGCLGRSVKVELNGERVPVKSFTDYVDLYLNSADKNRKEPLPRLQSNRYYLKMDTKSTTTGLRTTQSDQIVEIEIMSAPLRSPSVLTDGVTGAENSSRKSMSKGGGLSASPGGAGSTSSRHKRKSMSAIMKFDVKEIYVVDSLDRERIDKAKAEFQAIIKDPFMLNSIILVFANKQEMSNPQPRKHSLWQATADFTDGQASMHRWAFIDLSADPFSWGPAVGGEGVRTEISLPNVEKIIGAVAELWLSFWSEIHYNSLYERGDVPVRDSKKKHQYNIAPT